MLHSLRIILTHPSLRLIAALLGLTGIIQASMAPYQSFVAIDLIGLGTGAFALVLVLASVAGVAAAVGAGVITDQRANRRLIALVSAGATIAGPVLMLLWPGPISLVLCHGLLLPASGSLFGQCFALARLACHDRPQTQADGILAALRALLSLTFLLTLLMWSAAFSWGLGVMAIYGLATLTAVAIAWLTWHQWPRDGHTVWPDPPSGLNLRQSLAEIAQGRVLGRIALLGAITAASALYMTLISLVFADTPGRTSADVALFVGLVAGFEVPSMLLIPGALRYLSRSGLIALGGLLYAVYLALIPVLAGDAAIWLLPLLAGLAGGAIFTLPIPYLQDLVSGRPGTGSSLMAVQKVTADTLNAAAFAFGTALGGYQGAALLGAGVCALGAAALLWADRRPALRAA